ncbi:HD domain-containing protein [bacterium]|nr:HD domain-containing protein [bacterium]
MDSFQPSHILVQRLPRPPENGRRYFLPLAPAFLSSGWELPFHLYSPLGKDRVVPFLSRGEKIPARLYDAILRGRATPYFYVRSDERASLYRYEEDLLDEILETSQTPLSLRCRALHNLTAHLAREAYENPHRDTLSRQSAHCQKVTAFLDRHPPAVARTLTRMGDRRYSDHGHAVNVGFLSLAMAKTVHGRILDSGDEEMASGFFLYDVGKSRIQRQILDKPGPLKKEEWAEVRKHPIYGHSLLERSCFFDQPALQIALAHHERLDGRGYPWGLCGREIHPFARICALADTFDALTAHRPHKSALSIYSALSLMKQDLGSRFDGRFFDALVLLFRR